MEKSLHRLTVDDWIFAENLKPFVEMLAHAANCPLDDDDWTAISYGVRDSNGDEEKWYTYPLEGQPRLHLELAAMPGSAVVSVRIRGPQDSPPELPAQIELLVVMCQTYSILPHSAQPSSPS